jgi:hypothetical protein
MKVKIAESIMFGKVVFGTPKAFEGYCSDFPDIFIECNEDEDFIYQINNFDYSLGNIYKKGQLALEIFRNTYSNDNNNKYFLPILNTLKSK